MTCLGLDIGGANLKAANTAGFAAARYFRLWQKPQELGAVVAELIALAPESPTIAITMTGELADCFRTKAEGVRQICTACQQAAGSRKVMVYTTSGDFLLVPEAMELPIAVAAANWHALASFASRRFAIGSGLLIDLGSTTCDIIPIASQRPASRGLTDTQRLLSGELVYTGVTRTPICALMPELPYRGQICPVAAELFATTRDAYLMLGTIEQDSEDTNTADGRPATREFALERLARTICADRGCFEIEDAVAAARAARAAQKSLIEKSIARVVNAMDRSPETIVLSGQGEFLLREIVHGRKKNDAAEFGRGRAGEGGRAAMSAERALECVASAIVISLNDVLGPELSRAAPAYAVAVLAEGLS